MRTGRCERWRKAERAADNGPQGRAPRRSAHPPQEVASPQDSLNRDIIRMLQQDGRMPYAEIAAALECVRRHDPQPGQLDEKRSACCASSPSPIRPAVEYRTEAMLGHQGGARPHA